MDLENRLVVAKGEGKGVGWTGNLGFNVWHKYTYLHKRKKLMDIEKRLVVAEGEGLGWIRSLGLVDANDCTWSG